MSSGPASSISGPVRPPWKRLICDLIFVGGALGIGVGIVLDAFLLRILLSTLHATTTGLTYSLLFLSLAVVVGIPLAARRGNPKNFNRLKWMGLALVAVLFAVAIQFSFVVLMAVVGNADYKVPQIVVHYLPKVLGLLAGLSLSVATGSLVGVLFYRPKARVGAFERCL